MGEIEPLFKDGDVKATVDGQAPKHYDMLHTDAWNDRLFWWVDENINERDWYCTPIMQFHFRYEVDAILFRLKCGV